jgi:hypothetical protein
MQFKRKGTVIITRLFKGEEFLESIRSLCTEESISSGRIQAIGAVQQATLGYFDPGQKEYIDFECAGEVVSCMGTISTRKDTSEIIIHAHAVIADREGSCKGGHVVQAIPSVTLEVIIEEGPNLYRSLDSETGLYLLDL